MRTPFSMQELNTDTERFAVVNISVANMRREPVFQSELVNQTILGTVLPLYEEQNDFCYIQNWDGYFGWVTRASLTIISRAEAREWLKSPAVVQRRNYGLVTTEPSGQGTVVTDLVPFARLVKLGQMGESLKVALPDGRSGYAQRAGMVWEKAGRSGKEKVEAITTFARQFLGVPYLWGGTSAKAFDCSGFVQTAYRLAGVCLPRNASQMAEVGSEISTGLNEVSGLKTGDLLLFGRTRRRITHVALMLTGGEFIHSDGYVRINSLDTGHEAFSQFRRETLLFARRVPELAE